MASAHTIVTCEQLVSHELVVSNPKDVVIPFLAVDAVIEVPFGGYPGACRRHYYFNGEHIKQFHAAAEAMRKDGTTDFLRAYYDENIFGVEDFGDFISKFPVKKLLADQAAESLNCERLA
jgi:glutaconate CoA-transferase subunit A